jgi:hypothetical protein
MAVRFRVAYPGRPDLAVVHRDDWALSGRVLSGLVAGGAERVWVVIAHGGPADDGRWRGATTHLGTLTSPSGRPRPYLLVVGRRPDSRADQRGQHVAAPLTPSSWFSLTSVPEGRDQTGTG